MLNRVILMGRITQDLELKSTPSGVSVLTFNIAVERSFAKQGEERQADFITCVARITSYNVCYTKLLRLICITHRQRQSYQ